MEVKFEHSLFFNPALHNGSMNEEFLRRLGHMTENLSQVNSFKQHLMTNNRNLAKKFDLLAAVMDTVASNLSTTSKNISSQMDGLAEAIGERFCTLLTITSVVRRLLHVAFNLYTCWLCVSSQGNVHVLQTGCSSAQAAT